MPFRRDAPSTRAARASSTAARSSARTCCRRRRRWPLAGCMRRSAPRRRRRRIGAKALSMPDVLLETRDLAKYFDVSRPWLNRVIEGAPRQILKAVDGVSFEIKRGETLSLVGESGCGKSTVARLICGLYGPTRGHVVFGGTDLGTITRRSDMLTMRRRFQMIFQ